MLCMQVVTKLPGMDAESDLTLGSKKEQAELLTAVLKASDDDADEEVLQTSVSERQYRVSFRGTGGICLPLRSGLPPSEFFFKESIYHG